MVAEPPWHKLMNANFQRSPVTRDEPARKPRLLLLAYYFPPMREIGAVRAFALAKYLSRLDWKVTVVTLDPSLLAITDDAVEISRRLGSEQISRIVTSDRLRFTRWGFFKERKKSGSWLVNGLLFKIAKRLKVSIKNTWVKPAFQACSDLAPGDVDLILATAPPFSAFQVAPMLSRQLKCPYLLDYRDLWTGGSKTSRRLLRIARKEAEAIREAAAVVTVSWTFSEVLCERHKVAHKCHVITNGFDPEEYAEITPEEFDHFAMVYTGRLYPEFRTVKPLLRLMKLLHEQMEPGAHGGKIVFHYYGPDSLIVAEHARELAVPPEAVQIHGEISRSEALRVVKGAAIAAVVNTDSASETGSMAGTVPGKLFEPIAIGTPILLITPPGTDAARVVESCGSGRAFRATDLMEMKDFVLKIVRGGLHFEGTALTKSEYEWPSIARRYDALLRNTMR